MILPSVGCTCLPPEMFVTLPKKDEELIKDTKELIDSLWPLKGIKKYPKVWDVYATPYNEFVQVSEIRENWNVRVNYMGSDLQDYWYLNLWMWDVKSEKRMSWKYLFVWNLPVWNLF